MVIIQWVLCIAMGWMPSTRRPTSNLSSPRMTTINNNQNQARIAKGKWWIKAIFKQNFRIQLNKALKMFKHICNIRPNHFKILTRWAPTANHLNTPILFKTMFLSIIPLIMKTDSRKEFDNLPTMLSKISSSTKNNNKFIQKLISERIKAGAFLKNKAAFYKSHKKIEILNTRLHANRIYVLSYIRNPETLAFRVTCKTDQ